MAEPTTITFMVAEGDRWEGPDGAVWVVKAVKAPKYIIDNDKTMVQLERVIKSEVEIMEFVKGWNKYD